MGRSNRAAVIGCRRKHQPWVTTDFDGNFSINAQNGEVLIISYVGNQSNYNISLQTDNALEEVVVTTAYGTQRKISVVGTIATITNETIDNVQATSVIGSIQGSVPGENILTAGGVPGTNPTTHQKKFLGHYNRQQTPEQSQPQVKYDQW